MITEFKIFESWTKYLSDEDEKKFAEYITPIIHDYFDKKIPKLKLGQFISNDFSYRRIIDSEIFDSLFYNNIYNYAKKNFTGGTPKYHNSFARILDIILSDSVLKGQDSNIYMKIENRLISIFEKNPKLYKDNYNFYGDELSATVKDKLKYILDSEKYNL